MNCRVILMMFFYSIFFRNLQAFRKACSRTLIAVMIWTKLITVSFELCSITWSEWLRNIKRHRGLWSWWVSLSEEKRKGRDGRVGSGRVGEDRRVSSRSGNRAQVRWSGARGKTRASPSSRVPSQFRANYSVTTRQVIGASAKLDMLLPLMLSMLSEPLSKCLVSWILFKSNFVSWTKQFSSYKPTLSLL